MVGDISIGEYNLLIKNVTAVEDDTEYECQVTKFMLRSRRAKLTVLGEALILFIVINVTCYKCRFSKSLQNIVNKLIFIVISSLIW